MITKEDILLNVLNRYGNIADVENEFSNIQLEVIYKAMAQNAMIVNGLVMRDEPALHKQSVINWAFYPEEIPSYGDEILLQYPPEQCRTMPKIVTVYDKDTELIDGCKWALITPCL